jgi:cytochrome b6-f complex iron-sulfur subunit
MDASDDAVSASDGTLTIMDLPTVSRRAALRRMWVLAGGAAAAVVAAEACGATLWGLYPTLTNRFGGPYIVGHKSDFPAALPKDFELDTARVFYRSEARTFIVHLSANTQFLLDGSTLTDALGAQSFTRENDGSYWLALYQACPHLGSRLAFRTACRSFKCPSHGAHFHADGEYLDGPSPRSMDRFPLRLEGLNVVIDTGQLLNSVPRPETTARLLDFPIGVCIG